MKELAICSNGMKFKNIYKTRKVKKLEKRLRRLQRRVSCKYLKNKEGSKYAKTSNIIKIEKQGAKSSALSESLCGLPSVTSNESSLGKSDTLRRESNKIHRFL